MNRCRPRRSSGLTAAGPLVHLRYRSDERLYAMEHQQRQHTTAPQARQQQQQPRDCQQQTSADPGLRCSKVARFADGYTAQHALARTEQKIMNDVTVRPSVGSAPGEAREGKVDYQDRIGNSGSRERRGGYDFNRPFRFRVDSRREERRGEERIKKKKESSMLERKHSSCNNKTATAVTPSSHTIKATVCRCCDCNGTPRGCMIGRK